jgi:peptidoglycan/xylan/chitin deacetylase (PgdA/CDA1 family)
VATPLEAAKTVDRYVSRAHLSLFGEGNSLIIFVFHELFDDQREIDVGHVEGQQRITVEQFRRFVDYFLNHGYAFVSPDDLLSGLDPAKKFVLITFDDGYFNNLRALPVLEEFGVPAVFCISIGHVVERKAFWWDVVHRERVRRGASMKAASREIGALRKKTHIEIDRYLIDTFGRHALRPVGDIDRSFTPAELRVFAEHELVFLGNHTYSHAILSNYSYAEMRAEVQVAQNLIARVTGVSPLLMAYPNGTAPTTVVPILQECGLRLGVTVAGLKNALPLHLEDSEAFYLNRFVLWGDVDIERQCASCRSDLHVGSHVKRWMRGGVGQAAAASY